jgi:hypothetical protein
VTLKLAPRFTTALLIASGLRLKREALMNVGNGRGSGHLRVMAGSVTPENHRAMSMPIGTHLSWQPGNNPDRSTSFITATTLRVLTPHTYFSGQTVTIPVML